MGRSRLTLKRIENDACRKSTFKQRRDVLLNKMKELSNFCNAEEGEAANACLIVYDTIGGNPQPVTWPRNLNVEHSLIQWFESEKNEEAPIMFGIQDYFKNKTDKVEADISKVRKEIVKIQYPTSHPCFNNLGDEQIRNFLAVLDAKGRACTERMNILRLQQQVQVNSSQPVLDMDSQSQMLHFDPNPMQLMANNNGMMDSANEIGLPLDCATQVGSPNHVGIPFDLTIQSDPAVVSANQLDEVDWSSLIDGLIDFDTLPHEFVFYDDFFGY
ncbi:putative transcription factor MADS-type1 family [Lupinus albus]|uniref:Putative transcription factor MADS-type1 family n=1 Tax=Lupinus albus TaxID=3870 RepID=A0A6A4Q321_LUPAL|nr:putative transcription factor MADS-type1 family [Lupinus albus]